MIDKAYYYFLKSKYTKSCNKKELVRLKDLFAKSFSMKISIGEIGVIKRASIEKGVIGRELTDYERAVDNYIMGNPSIVRGFFQISFEEEKETLDQVSESIKKIRKSILDNMSARERELFFYSN